MNGQVWQGKRVAVVGLGVSNTALIRFLIDKGAEITGLDKKSEAELEETYGLLRSMGVHFKLGPGYLDNLESFDEVFVSPGVPKHLPELVSWQRAGRILQSEMNLFFELCPVPIVGITGSSGKTTTTTLVGEMLRAGGFSTWVGGNIGTPLIDKLGQMQNTDWVVLELSSFQLEVMHKSPQVAVVTNITPNHLDVHPTMEDYVAAKSRIFLFQNKDDHLILNWDYDLTKELGKKAPGSTVFFSRRVCQSAGFPTGAFVENGKVVVYWPAHERREICPVEEIKLLGAHNIENILAAAAASSICGVSPKAIREVAATFCGVAHRLEPVGVHEGVSYYNDSIATTPARAMAGIASFNQPVVLIAGGYDKKLPFNEFADMVVEKCKGVVLLGATAGKIEEALEASMAASGRQLDVRRALDLEEAVRIAETMASPGDVVLLSPACASYDMFRNYAERGDRFRSLVRALSSSSAVHR